MWLLSSLVAVILAQVPPKGLNVKVAIVPPQGCVPRLIGSIADGRLYSMPRTALVGYQYLASFMPQCTVPVVADPATLTYKTDGSYSITGGETHVHLIADGAGAHLPGAIKGRVACVTSGGKTTCTRNSGDSFTAAMAGQMVNVGQAQFSGKYFNDFRTKCLTFIDADHITISMDPKPWHNAATTWTDQTDSPIWFGPMVFRSGTAGSTPEYLICDVAGNTFTLRQKWIYASDGSFTHVGDCTNPKAPFGDAGTGPQYLAFTGGPNGAAYMNPTVTGLPTGAIYKWLDVFGSEVTNPAMLFCNDDTYTQVTLVVDVPAVVALQDWTPQVTVSTLPSGAGNVSSFSWTMTTRSAVISRTPPSSFPAIPQRALWESYMTSDSANGADHYCSLDGTALKNMPNGSTISLYEGEIWYPDGMRALNLVADYTGDARYRNCAAVLSKQYADLVYASCGSATYPTGCIPYQRPYSNGLMRSFVWSGDPSIRAGAHSLTAMHTTGQYGAPLSYIGPERGAAVGLAILQADEMMGYPRNIRYSLQLSVVVNRLLEMLDGFVLGQQSFYIGFSIEALITEYEKSLDQRIPYVLVKLAEWWKARYDATKYHSSGYGLSPEGAECSSGPGYPLGAPVRFGPGTMWWTQWGELDTYCITGGYTNGADGPDPFGPFNGLNLTWNEIWAWAWRWTGDDSYRALFDDSFSHAFHNPPFTPVDQFPLYGKYWVQQYRMSIPAVKYRSAGCIYSTDAAAQVISASTASKTVAVHTPYDGTCAWTAASPVDWVIINSGSAGTGEGSVSYTVAENIGTARSAVLTIAGQPLRVQQGAGIVIPIQ